MNLKTIYNKITGDIRAVSPVVATLVLIVVAIVGAAAVGTMTGVFTEDVGRQNASIRPMYSESLVIGGSTSVEPVARSLARGFMEANPSVRITVQTGGTGAGIRAVGHNVIDIGMASSNVTPAQFEQFPGIVGRVVQIGNSTVLLVGNAATLNMTTANLNNITVADLRELFVNDTIVANVSAAGVTHGVFRSDRSGTGDQFAQHIVGAGASPMGHDNIHAGANTRVEFAAGNTGVVSRIRANTGRIGGICIGYAAGVNLTEALHLRRDRPFQLITNGAPSRLEQAFLDYARSPEAVAHFRALNVTSIVA